MTDYYLIPGAEWSLLKKGDTIKVLGKAGADGRWYRCMALRDTDVKVPDRSLPPPSIVNALLPETIIRQDPEKGITKGAVSSSQRGHGGLGSSQLQRDVVMEDPLNEAMEEGMEGEEEEDRGESVSASSYVHVHTFVAVHIIYPVCSSERLGIGHSERLSVIPTS